MSRITNKMLYERLNLLNNVVGHPNPRPQEINTYDIEMAYDGVKLIKYSNNYGGVVDVFKCGYTSKRELFDLIDAFIKGINIGSKE